MSKICEIKAFYLKKKNLTNTTIKSKINPKDKNSNKTTGSTDSNETKITFNKNAPAFQYKIGRKELKGLKDDSNKQFSEISSFSSISNMSNVSGNSKDNTEKTAEMKSEYQQTRNGKY